MLNFGFLGGSSSAPLSCSPTYPEMIRNWTFDCGLDGWQIYPGTTGSLVDNADGTITLTASDAYASIEPIVHPSINPADTYILTVVITALTGNAKISIMIDTTWTSTKFTTPGTYTQEFTGNLTEMVVGADNDATAVLTYDSFSVQKVLPVPDAIDDLVLTPGDGTLTMNWTAPNDNGYAITSYDLYLDGTWFGEVPPEQLTAEMTGLNNGQAYTMDARAVNANGQAPASNTPSGTPSASDNLIINGEFTTDLAEWYISSTDRGTYTWDAGRLKITNDADGDYPNVAQTTLDTLVIGTTYSYSFTVDIGTAPLVEFRLRLEENNLVERQISASGTYTGEVVADVASELNVLLYLWETGNTGNSCWFDNIVVTEVVVTNMIENGNFDTDLAGWDIANESTPTWVDGRMEILAQGPYPNTSTPITGEVEEEIYVIGYHVNNVLNATHYYIYCNEEAMVGNATNFGENTTVAYIKGATDDRLAIYSDGDTLDSVVSYDDVFVIPATLGAVNADVTSFEDQSTAPNTVTWVDNVATVHMEVAETESYKPLIRPSIDTVVVGEQYEIVFTIEILSGTAYINQIEAEDIFGVANFLQIDATVTTGTYIYRHIGNFDVNGVISLLFDGTTEFTFDATVTVEIRKINEVTNPVALTYVVDDDGKFILDDDGKYVIDGDR